MWEFEDRGRKFAHINCLLHMIFVSIIQQQIIEHIRDFSLNFQLAISTSTVWRNCDFYQTTVAVTSRLAPLFVLIAGWKVASQKSSDQNERYDTMKTWKDCSQPQLPVRTVLWDVPVSALFLSLSVCLSVSLSVCLSVSLSCLLVTAA
jgi:hypothetical protein